jgi:hypothetical protein
MASPSPVPDLSLPLVRAGSDVTNRSNSRAGRARGRQQRRGGAPARAGRDADIAFARAVRSERGSVRVLARGDVAWAATTSPTEGKFNGRPVNSAGAEALFRPRGHILTDNATTHGFAEYRDQFLKPELARFKAGYAHTAVEATVRGDPAYVAFRRVFGKAGGTQTEGRGTAVLEKIDGKWLIVHLQMAE